MTFANNAVYILNVHKLATLTTILYFLKTDHFVITFMWISFAKENRHISFILWILRFNGDPFLKTISSNTSAGLKKKNKKLKNTTISLFLLRFLYLFVKRSLIQTIFYYSIILSDYEQTMPLKRGDVKKYSKFSREYNNW